MFCGAADTALDSCKMRFFFEFQWVFLLFLLILSVDFLALPTYLFTNIRYSGYLSHFVWLSAEALLIYIQESTADQSLHFYCTRP